MSEEHSLFDIIDNVIAELEQRACDLEWGFGDEGEIERLKYRLDTLYVRRDSGEVLLPRF